MSQSTNDIVVEFELTDVDLGAILQWLVTLADKTWWPERDTYGRIIGMSFKYPEDAAIFKLKFEL